MRRTLTVRHDVSRGVRRPRRGARAGFTLVEVIFAVVLLGGVLLGFATFTRNFVRAGTRAGVRSAASDLAVDRVELAKAQATYAALDTLAGTESPVAGSPGFTRRTVVRRTATAQWDYKTVSATVTHATLAAPVSKTTIIAAY